VRERKRFDKMEKKWTNLARPTPGDSDVPPAEERANHIHTYSLMVARERSLDRGNGNRGDSYSGPPRARPFGVQQRVDDAITLTGHCESAGRDAIVRNDERRRERTPRFSLTAISLSFLV